MATVTGLTAERMLQIEAGSVVDGDVIGDNLILTKHDGTTINAGNVRGPAGPTGPVGTDLVVVSAKTVLDMGVNGQIRAGRQLTLADFTNIGLNAPIALWNLSDLTDASGNARSLTERRGGASGAVPIVGFPGVNGVANTAAQFPCNVSGASVSDRSLYILDSGSASDPFRIRTGSFGGWIRTAKRGVNQGIVTKIAQPGGALDIWFDLSVAGSNNGAQARISTNGNALIVAPSLADVCDDRWHFCVATYDGQYLKMYVDCLLEAQKASHGWMGGTGFGPVNVGGWMSDGANAVTSPCMGRLDEVFVTADVLSEEQIRNLYCAKIGHTLGTVPSRVSLNVRRRRRGAALTSADFPTQPLRLYNFSAGSVNNEGSNPNGAADGTTATLQNFGGCVTEAGADGSAGNAYSFNGTTNAFAATDAGLPAGLASRSYGCWVKTTVSSNNFAFLAYGTTTGGIVLCIASGGSFASINWGVDQINGPVNTDGQWHFVVGTEDNLAADGLKRKLYIDGRLVGSSALMAATTLGGAGKFRIGSLFDGTWLFPGQVDTAFVCGYALTAEQIASLYAKGSQVLAPSPKNVGDHIEALTATDLLATFDTLDSTAQVDLGVAA